MNLNRRYHQRTGSSEVSQECTVSGQSNLSKNYETFDTKFPHDFFSKKCKESVLSQDSEIVEFKNNRSDLDLNLSLISYMPSEADEITNEKALLETNTVEYKWFCCSFRFEDQEACTLF